MVHEDSLEQEIYRFFLAHNSNDRPWIWYHELLHDLGVHFGEEKDYMFALRNMARKDVLIPITTLECSYAFKLNQ